VATTREDDWANRVRQRLQLREARYQREGRWVRETRAGLTFLHVSKSGGTSLDNFFANFFPPEAMLPTELQVKRMVEWDDADWSRYRYFKLEWPYELTARRAPPQHFVTLLRDPVQRIVSLYKHLRRADDHTAQYDAVQARRSPEVEAARSLPLADWARLRPPEAGAYFRHPYLGMATIGVRNLLDKSNAELDALLERAKRNLREQFAFVGIVEEYLPSKRLFCESFGLPRHYAVGEERFNVAPDGGAAKSPPDGATLDLIRDENRWDAALYDFACELLAERCAELADTDRAGGAPAAGSDNELRWEPTVDRSEFGCDEFDIAALPGSGWYPVEQSPLGQAVRWTGALPTSTLDLIALWPHRGPLEVHLDVFAVIDAERIHDLQVRLDGEHPYSRRWIGLPHGLRLIAHFDLTPAIAARPLHQLELEGPLAAPPADSPADQPVDVRRLGVAVHAVACLWGGAARAERPVATVATATEAATAARSEPSPTLDRSGVGRADAA